MKEKQMATETKKSKGWPVIGSIRKSDTGSYIKLNDNVEILVDGVKIPLNDKRVLSLDKPSKKVEMLRDKGFLDEKTAEERLEKLAGMPWLSYEITARPPKRD
jgi:hypothetical protein